MLSLQLSSTTTHIARSCAASTRSGDVATAEGVSALVQALPAVDILVNNTGIFEPKPFFEIPDADWQRFYDVNVMSGVRLSRSGASGLAPASSRALALSGASNEHAQCMGVCST